MQRVTPEQILIAVGTLWLLLFVIGIYRMGGDVIGAVFPVDCRSGMTMWCVVRRFGDRFSDLFSIVSL